MRTYRHFYALIGILCLFVIVLGFMLWRSKQVTSPAQPEAIPASRWINQPLPDVQIMTQEGQGVSLSEFKGKPMVLMDWASWCQHCQKSMPIMSKLYQTYHDDITFIFLNATGSAQGKETRDRAANYRQQLPYEIPIYYDQQTAAANQLQVTAVPAYFFLDKKGVVKHVTTADMTENDLESQILNLLPHQNKDT